MARFKYIESVKLGVSLKGKNKDRRYTEINIWTQERGVHGGWSKLGEDVHTLLLRVTA